MYSSLAELIASKIIFLPSIINERNKLDSDIGKSSSEDIFRNALLKFNIGLLQ